MNAVAAALILADKSDVRRVRNADLATFDIHDRVNYSVRESQLQINGEYPLIELKLSVDTEYGSVMDYFEILWAVCCCAARRQKSWTCNSN